MLLHVADYRPGVWMWRDFELTGEHRDLLTGLLETLALGVATVARAAREHPEQRLVVQADSWQRAAEVYVQLLAARCDWSGVDGIDVD